MKLTYDNTIEKTYRQVQNMVRVRICKHSAASESKQAAIMADIETLLYMGKLTAREWDEAVAGVGEDLEQWGYKALNGSWYRKPTNYRKWSLLQAGTDKHLQTEIPKLEKVTKPKPIVEKVTKPEPEPKQKQKGQWGGKRAGAGRASPESIEHYKPIILVIQEGMKAGRRLQGIADLLNSKNYTTVTGKAFQRNHVHKIIQQKNLKW